MSNPYIIQWLLKSYGCRIFSWLMDHGLWITFEWKLMGLERFFWTWSTLGDKESKNVCLITSYRTWSTLVGYGMYVTIFNMSAFWNGLQRPHFGNSISDIIVKLLNIIEGFSCFKERFQDCLLSSREKQDGGSTS